MSGIHICFIHVSISLINSQKCAVNQWCLKDVTLQKYNTESREYLLFAVAAPSKNLQILMGYRRKHICLYRCTQTLKKPHPVELFQNTSEQAPTNNKPWAWNLTFQSIADWRKLRIHIQTSIVRLLKIIICVLAIITAIFPQQY